MKEKNAHTHTHNEKKEERGYGCIVNECKEEGYTLFLMHY